MVNSCSAYGCTNRFTKKDPNSERKPIQFHRFPFKRPDILQKWVIATRRLNWKPTSCSFLCSEHFEGKDYQLRPAATNKLLKDNAVPSVFNFPDHLKKDKNSRRCLARIIKEDVNDNGEIPECQNENLIEDARMEETETNRDIAIQCKLLSPEKIMLKRKAKILSQRLYRRDRKILTLKDLATTLKAKLGQEMGGTIIRTHCNSNGH